MTTSSDYSTENYPSDQNELRHEPIRKSGSTEKRKRPDYVRKCKAVRRGIKQRRVRRIMW